MMSPRIHNRPLSIDPGTLPAVHPVLARVYASRVHDAHELKLTWDALPSPARFADLPKAAERLAQAVMDREPIMVAADYDADGASAGAVLVRALRQFGGCVDCIVPDRRLEGYGLTEALALRIAAMVPQPRWVVTVDNGIVSHAGVARLQADGIPVIVTDHHLPAETLPPAYAVVNPRRADDTSGAVNLAGVGVAFLLAIAIRERLLERDWPAATPSLAPLLPLVALGTVADCVPLDRLNRLLVAQGLKILRAGRGLPGIPALATVARRELATLTAEDLAFSVGPRLNAAGRLEDMTIGIQALLAEDGATARGLAERLDGINRERRTIEATMREQAEALVRRDWPADLLPILCLHDPTWHEGVVGLVASRIREQCHRPAVAFAVGADGLLKGSARSVPGLHIRDCIADVAARHPGLVVRFGGHAQAAGLSIAPDRIQDFTSALEAGVSRYVTPDLFCDVITTDGILAAPECTLETAHALEAGGPWGQGFPAPLFVGDFTVTGVRLLSEGLHAKLILETADGGIFEGIAFQCQAHLGWCPAPGPVRLVYALSLNRYQGRESVQLVVERVFPSPCPLQH
ncbi:MAG: single-stranded-DNA-specific exonuclease RecJ [Acidiferrobacter sp.]